MKNKKIWFWNESKNLFFSFACPKTAKTSLPVCGKTHFFHFGGNHECTLRQWNKMTNARSEKWEDDESLEDALRSYMHQGLKRAEILSYMMKDFDKYRWSLRTLGRRLRHFEIFHTDPNVTVLIFSKLNNFWCCLKCNSKSAPL